MRLNQNVRRTRIVALLLAAGLLVAATPGPAAAQAYEMKDGKFVHGHRQTQ